MKEGRITNTHKSTRSTPPIRPHAQKLFSKLQSQGGITVLTSSIQRNVERIVTNP